VGWTEIAREQVAQVRREAERRRPCASRQIGASRQQGTAHGVGSMGPARRDTFALRAPGCCTVSPLEPRDPTPFERSPLDCSSVATGHRTRPRGEWRTVNDPVNESLMAVCDPPLVQKAARSRH
jgi:hypothetical protein